MRHHPNPSRLIGWCLLDSLRHCRGPIPFDPAESRDWGVVAQLASLFVSQVTACDRVYAIAFGEGSPHRHLIPRYADDPRTTAWKIADSYRDIDSGRLDPAYFLRLKDWFSRARSIGPKFLD